MGSLTPIQFSHLGKALLGEEVPALRVSDEISRKHRHPPLKQDARSKSNTARQSSQGDLLLTALGGESARPVSGDVAPL